MSRIAWKVRRLAAMAPAEIAHRARIALRDRLAAPGWTRLDPEAAFAALYRGDARAVLAGSRLRDWLRMPAAGPAFAPALEEAALLHEGRWRLFGRDVRLDDPPRWNLDPLTGGEWPDLPSARLDHRSADAGRTAKGAAELSRLSVLADLALAGRLEGLRAWSAQAARWLDDWCARHPLGHGLAHTSGLEMAIRVITMSATLALLDEDGPRPRLEPVLGLIAQQALWCRDHLSLGSSANNHLIGELAAMTAAGALFPALHRAPRLLREGASGLAREVIAQIHPDGVPAEQAFGYLPFVWSLTLAAATAAEAAGAGLGEAARERLRASLEFARVMRLPDGRLPQVGDEDDGRVLLVADGWSPLDLAGNALAAWLDADALSDGSAALALLLCGRPPGPARAAAAGRHEFPAGGWTVWRDGDLHVTFDHGPLGLGSLAAHGHADALAVTVFRGADGVVVDPGTLAYHEDPKARETTRSTPAHSTVSFGGRSQAEMLGPFLWGRRATVSPDGPGWVCVWPTGETHARHVDVAGGVVTIADRVSGRDAELALALAPGAEVSLDGARATVRSGRARATIEIEGGGPWRSEPSQHAPRFGLRVPALRLASRIAERATTRIAVEGG